MNLANPVSAERKSLPPNAESLIPADGLPVDSLNRRFAGLSAEARVEFALSELPGRHIVSSSFGAQAAVMLHLATSVRPDIPVVLVDTGYLFAETYRFIDELTERLDLNVVVYHPRLSAARQEALFGQRWLDGLDGLNAYNHDNKVEPMQRALADLDVGTWLTGIRRDQANSRTETPFLRDTGERLKVAPIADWSDRDVHRYLQKHNLPYHPLWEQGYISIGDVHSTKSIHEVDNVEETRFFGLKRECGLHDSVA